MWKMILKIMGWLFALLFGIAAVALNTQDMSPVAPLMTMGICVVVGVGIYRTVKYRNGKAAAIQADASRKVGPLKHQYVSIYTFALGAFCLLAGFSPPDAAKLVMEAAGDSDLMTIGMFMSAVYLFCLASIISDVGKRV